MRTDFALPVETANQIDQILANARQMARAECALFAQISGQLISVQGQIEGIDPVLVATLAAGDVAAMTELSHQIGERNPCGSFLHEGESKSIYLFSVEGKFILIVVFQADTPAGLVRLFAGRAAEELSPLAAEIERAAAESGIPDDSTALSADFGSSLADELEKLERQFSGL
jgi:predicted regulator of Ras-like GTPase activity (Roadblock/LC7/MglB family)